MKRSFLFFVIPFALLLRPNPIQADNRGFINTVVIDPGHGGRDPGALGRNTREKDITLAISLKLGNYIREHLPDVKVIYTRETDVFIPLHRRAQIANENHADLFISIHCNSHRNTSAFGTETFVMGLHKSEANLEVARKENASILYEDDYLETYGGFDPNSPEASIIFNLYQNAFLDQSLSVASLVQDQFRERAMRNDRGVKQAGFLVLYQITMPGVLIEAGFLSNAREEQYLMSDTGQAHIASSIFRAFRDYKHQHDALAASRKSYAQNQNNQVTTNNTEPTQSSQHLAQQHQRQEEPTEQSKAMQQGREQEQEQAQTRIQEQEQEQAQTRILEQEQEQAQKQEQIQLKARHQPESERPTINYRVQIFVSSQHKALDSSEFKGLADPGVYYHEGLYKYTVGYLDNFDKAADLQTKLKQSGYPDAFIVAFSNDERISVSEAARLISAQSSHN